MIIEVLRRGKPTRYSLEKLLQRFVIDQKMVNAVKTFQPKQKWMEPYFVACLWYNGNLNDASSSFRKLFFENDRNLVFVLLKEITLDTVGKRGEATLVILTQLAAYFSCILDDHRLLFYVWRITFTSEWHSDQQHANDLFSKSFHLRQLILRKLPNLCQLFLSNENTDAVHRILQLYLRENDRESVQTILTIMYDHSYLGRNMASCLEILRFSEQLEIPIGKSLGFRIANLLMDKRTDKKHVIQPPKFKFKF